VRAGAGCVPGLSRACGCTAGWMDPARPTRTNSTPCGQEDGGQKEQHGPQLEAEETPGPAPWLQKKDPGDAHQHSAGREQQQHAALHCCDQACSPWASRGGAADLVEELDEDVVHSGVGVRGHQHGRAPRQQRLHGVADGARLARAGHAQHHAVVPRSQHLHAADTHPRWSTHTRAGPAA
jgi:hypothetical protein